MKTKTYYAVLAVGHGSAIDDVRARLSAVLGRPRTLRLLSYRTSPSGVVTHSTAELRFETDADGEMLDAIEAAELEE